MKTTKQHHSKGFSLTEFAVVAFISLILILVIGVPSCKALGGANIEYSEGSRKGTVYKISKKGYIWDTYEGELSLGLTTQNSEGQLVNKIFYFSVSDESIAEELEKAMLSNQQVKISYQEYLLRGWKHGGTSYNIIKVEPIN